MHVTLNQVQEMGTLQRSYKWNLKFMDLPVEVTNAVPNASDQLNIRCISSSVPKPRIDPVSANPHGIDLFEPGIVHLDGDIRFEIVETTDIKSYRIIRALWQINMQDQDKKQADMTGTRKKSFDVELTRLDNYNDANLVYTCKKCFLLDFDDPGFTSDSGVMRMSFTIKYNWFTVEPNTTSSSGNLLTVSNS